MQKCPHALDQSRLSVLEELRSNSFGQIKSLTTRARSLNPDNTDDPDRRSQILAELSDVEAELEAVRAERDEIGALYAACKKVLEAE